MAETLLRIIDAFTIRGRGVVVAGHWAELGARHVVRIGDPIAVARADGTRLRTTIRGIEMFDPSPSDDRAAILLGPEITREDVAPGDEVVRDESGEDRSEVVAPVRVDESSDPG